MFARQPDRALIPAMAMVMAEMTRPLMRTYHDQVSDRWKGFHFEESRVAHDFDRARNANRSESTASGSVRFGPCLFHLTLRSHRSPRFLHPEKTARQIASLGRSEDQITG
jgi:hypothetical protein